MQPGGEDDDGAFAGASDVAAEVKGVALGLREREEQREAGAPRVVDDGGAGAAAVGERVAGARERLGDESNQTAKPPTRVLEGA